VVDPFRKILMNPGDAEHLKSFGPAAAVAVGLALRFGGDG